ncbi:hypothetical protein [Kistimonas asteriae]|uniref:hypothetical protein n=1 Tax=Kistimonas asteriae TaxID=517724 RepID=UPI001BA9E24C|nr:hypothetical protein [Kistimonas asteriae]
MEEIAETIIDELSGYWGNRVKDFVEMVSTSTPYNRLEMAFTAYNFMVVKLTVEYNFVWFSQLNSGALLKFTNTAVPLESITKALPKVYNEIRLRIPDKYLEANGW